MKISDAVTGAALAVLGLVILWHIQGFPEMQGQKFGPAWFPGIVAAGLAVCGAQYDGVGIPACIASAHAAVDQIQGDLTAVRELTANPVQSLHGGAGE